MPRFSYRNRLRLKKLLRGVLTLLAITVLAGIVLLIYAEPYIVYSRDGARLDFSDEPTQSTTSESAAPRPVVSNPQIVYSEDPIAEKTIAEMGGYYITTKMLLEPQSVLDAVKSLDEPCAVLIELKSVYGNFYYSTGISTAPKADVETAVVDELLSYLKQNHFYMIAVVPAFCDRAYALDNVSCGLPLKSGALWMDSNNCYWLDPVNDTVVSYLIQISRELAELGFNEVAFSNFCFPNTDKIVYSSEKSRSELLEQTIRDLNAFAQGSSLKISFVTEDTSFPTDELKGRLYFPNVDGSRVELYAGAYESAEGLLELVFLANSRDTRFEGRAQLRPLLAE